MRNSLSKKNLTLHFRVWVLVRIISCTEWCTYWSSKLGASFSLANVFIVLFKWHLNLFLLLNIWFLRRNNNDKKYSSLTLSLWSIDISRNSIGTTPYHPWQTVANVISRSKRSLLWGDWIISWISFTRKFPSRTLPHAPVPRTLSESLISSPVMIHGWSPRNMSVVWRALSISCSKTWLERVANVLHTHVSRHVTHHTHFVVFCARPAIASRVYPVDQTCDSAPAIHIYHLNIFQKREFYRCGIRKKRENKSR